VFPMSHGASPSRSNSNTRGHHHRHHSSSTAGNSDVTKKVAPTSAVDLRNLGSYEHALTTFRQYDLDKDGRFSWRELHSLMTDLNKPKCIPWTDGMNDQLMQRLDRRQDGGVSIDEFIQYIFQRTDAMGGDAGSSGYELVLEAFRRHDANRNGKLEKDEFNNLMMGLHPGQWDYSRTEQVFRLVDKDHNGAIESEELVSWIFGVPRDREKAAARARRNDTGGVGLVAFEFTCGSGAEHTVDKMAARWAHKFGEKVVVQKNVMGSSSTIQRVAAREGRVVFWDAPTMMAYRENPFANHTALVAWCEDMTKRHIPRLLAGT
jgi:Ca2+-binding EF-hand superfamily protein